MSIRLTAHGSTLAAKAAFADAEIALFDHQEQVTDWQPYSVEDNTPVTAPRRLAGGADLHVRSTDGEAAVHWPVRGVLEQGHVVSPPPPGTWFTQRDAEPED